MTKNDFYFFSEKSPPKKKGEISLWVEFVKSEKNLKKLFKSH